MDSLMEDRSQIADAISAVHAQTCYRRRASDGSALFWPGGQAITTALLVTSAGGPNVEGARRRAGPIRGTSLERLGRRGRHGAPGN